MLSSNCWYPIAVLCQQITKYLEQTAAGTQTRENVANFLGALSEQKSIRLTEAERLQMINLRANEEVDVYLVG
jgi:hypothetical protein